MADFVTLTCPSCGGKLEITSDIDRFACSHCGREHIVKRSGGIISLSPVVDELKKVGVGVDKTAAELAIVRLQKEIAELQAKRVAMLQFSPRPATSPLFAILLVCGCLVAALFLPLTAMSSYNTEGILGILVGVAMIVLGALPLFVFRPSTKQWDETTGIQLKSLDEQITAKNAELKHHREVVSL
jgi:hypothetical protein